MYIEAIKFQREENSEWEAGYYVGEFENCGNSVILDSKYQPLKDGKLWEYRSNPDNWIKFNIPENNEDDV